MRVSRSFQHPIIKLPDQVELLVSRKAAPKYQGLLDFRSKLPLVKMLTLSFADLRLCIGPVSGLREIQIEALLSESFEDACLCAQLLLPVAFKTLGHVAPCQGLSAVARFTHPQVCDTYMS